MNITILSALAQEEIQTSYASVEVIKVDTLWEKIINGFKNIGNTQQTILAGDTGELRVGVATSVLLTFTPICTTGDKLSGVSNIVMNNKKILGTDISSKLICNERRNIKYSFTPKEEGTYNIYYKITNMNHPGDDIKIDTEGGIALSSETREFKTVPKQGATFKPYCVELAKTNINNNGVLIGYKAEEKCYKAPGDFDTEVIIKCNDGYQSNNLINDYSQLMCIKKEVVQPETEGTTTEETTKLVDEKNVNKTVTTTTTVDHEASETSTNSDNTPSDDTKPRWIDTVNQSIKDNPILTSISIIAIILSIVYIANKRKK